MATKIDNAFETLQQSYDYQNVQGILSIIKTLKNEFFF